MTARPTALFFALFVLLICATPVTAVTVQDPNDLLPDGSAYMLVEAEDYSELGGDDPNLGFLKVDNVNPIKSIETAVKGNLDILPADTNASGGAALLDQLGGGHGTHTAKWEMQFTTPATYYLYVHASIYNSDGDTSYGNEDSFFVPPAFNLNSREDWIGFEGVDLAGDPATGDNIGDGWMPIFNNKVVMSGGLTEVHNDTNEDFWDGYFHWMHADFGVDVDENGTYIDDIGMAIQYAVTEEDINQVQAFEISTREHYGVIDALLFSTSNELLFEYTQEQMAEFFVNVTDPLQGDFDSDGQLGAADVNDLTVQVAGGANPAAYDLNADTLVDSGDIGVWVKDLYNSWIGDANLDGEFNSGDLVDVLATGTYEVDVDSNWSSGDFDGDGRTNSGDLVAALADGGYEAGPREGAAAVPEPASGLLGLMAFGMLLGLRRR
jgi:MYXO-CTERM domain-containing protein